jgi:hypothetical protein
MPASSSSTTKRILVCSRGLSAYIEDKVQWGIRRFALSRPDWRIGHLHSAQVDAAHVRDVLGWEPDGLLVVTNPSRVPKLFKLEQLPTVVTNLQHELLTGVSSVAPDNRGCGHTWTLDADRVGTYEWKAKRRRIHPRRFDRGRSPAHHLRLLPTAE